MMRSLAVLVAIVALPAFAEPADPYRWEAPVTVTGKDALNRITLPIEVYRDARPDLADLRILNASGEALPMAYAGEATPVRTEPAPVALPIFPVTAEEAPRGSFENLDVQVRSSADGTIVSVHGRGQGKAAQRTVAWLVDAIPFKEPMQSLAIEWRAKAGAEVVAIDVDASDDLKSWRRVASGAQLVQLERDGARLEQRRVPMGALRAKYLRIASGAAAFELSGVSVRAAEVVSRAPRMKLAVDGRAGAKERQYVFDLGARVPIDAVRIVLPPNTVAPLVIGTDDSQGKQPLHVLTAATFYHLVRDTATVESPAVEVPRREARSVQALLDPRSPPLAAPPRLEVEWQPAQVIFVARGEGPYRLAFGKRDARARLESKA